MIKFKFLIVLAMSFIFAACGSKDDGTRYISNIGIVSKVDKEAELYPGNFKISIKDKDGSYDWFYTNQEYTVGDSLTFILISHRDELEISKAELEIAEAKIVSQDSIITVLTNYKTQSKALTDKYVREMAELEKD